MSALPERWQPVLSLNPLVLVIEQTRAVLVGGHGPSPLYLGLGIPLSMVVCEVCSGCSKGTPWIRGCDVS